MLHHTSDWSSLDKDVIILEKLSEKSRLSAICAQTVGLGRLYPSGPELLKHSFYPKAEVPERLEAQQEILDPAV